MWNLGGKNNGCVDEIGRVKISTRANKITVPNREGFPPLADEESSAAPAEIGAPLVVVLLLVAEDAAAVATSNCRIVDCWARMDAIARAAGVSGDEARMERPSAARDLVNTELR